LENKPISVRILLRASVSPSEDASKVLLAATNVLGDCQHKEEISEELVALSSESLKCLQKLHDQLRDRRVRDAARRLLLRRREDNRVTLMLNRQAALKGTIVLCGNEDESPLGPIFMVMDSDQTDQLIEWLTSHQDSG
jgi:predicted RNA binding protein with dsRBD fold (UPF0201 family)